MENDKLIIQLRNTEQEILDVFHSVCQKNNLKYSLAYGTLLGAIRHKGFIPWDDDIDVMMPREDYEKLIEIWDKETTEKYIIQNKEISSDFTQTFSKIRKNNTAFIQDEEERNKEYHKGIFIDIFPADKVPNSLLKQKIQYFAGMINLLYSREYNSGKKGVYCFVENLLLKFPKSLKMNLKRKSENYFKKCGNKNSIGYVCSGSLKSCGIYYDKELFSNCVLQYFEDREYMVTDKYMSYLFNFYGDYMQLPPEEERVWTHHPILIDFDHNYEDIDKKG